LLTYGDVVEHPEQIFAGAGMAQDFVRQADGSLKNLRSFRRSCAR
jgi:hypothetical protein